MTRTKDFFTNVRTETGDKLAQTRRTIAAHEQLGKRIAVVGLMAVAAIGGAALLGRWQRS